MRLRRPITAVLVSLGLLAGVGGPVQKGNEPEARRSLDPSVTAVRLLLGVGDPARRSWNGRVKVDRGEVVGVEGYRFREGDLVTGRDAWEAKSPVIRRAAPKKQQQTSQQQPTGAARKESTAGHGRPGPVTPNGVIVSVKCPTTRR